MNGCANFGNSLFYPNPCWPQQAGANFGGGDECRQQPGGQQAVGPTRWGGEEVSKPELRRTPLYRITRVAHTPVRTSYPPRSHTWRIPLDALRNPCNLPKNLQMAPVCDVYTHMCVSGVRAYAGMFVFIYVNVLVCAHVQGHERGNQ